MRATAGYQNIFSNISDMLPAATDAAVKQEKHVWRIIWSHYRTIVIATKGYLYNYCKFNILCHSLAIM